MEMQMVSWTLASVTGRSASSRACIAWVITSRAVSLKKAWPPRWPEAVAVSTTILA